MNRLTFRSLGSLMLISLTSCGASLDTAVNYSIRNRLSQVPGLAWFDPITPIGEINQSNAGEPLFLEGRVEQQLPLVEQSVYQLTDGSGDIWVITSNPPPSPGETVTIQATIRYELILLGGQDIGEHYAEETERLPQDES